MLIKFLILFAVAAIAPQVFSGVKVKGLVTAALVAVVFGVLNVLLGGVLAFLLKLFGLPVILLTLGLAALLVTPIVNTILLKLTDAVLEGFEIKGLGTAFGMGLLFAVANWLGDVIVYVTA